MSATLKDEDRIFAELLKRFRRQLGKTQEDVAGEIFVSPSIYNKWENGAKPVPHRRVLPLANALCLPAQSVSEFLESKSKIKVYGGSPLSSWIAEGVPIQTLLQEIAEIIGDNPFPEIPEGIDGSNDMGDDDKWDELIQAYPSGCYLVQHRLKRKMVAYWHLLSVTDELYASAISGHNVNKEIKNSDVRGFDVPFSHDLYFVDLFRRAGYESNLVNEALLLGFLDFLKDLASSGHYVRRICTHASTFQAENLCRDLGFDYICDHKDHRRWRDAESKDWIPTKIFELDLPSKLDARIFGLDAELRGIYRRKYN